MCVPGILILFLFPKSPPFIILQTTSFPSILITSSSIFPSSTKITVPGFTSLYNSLYVTVTLFESPMISSFTKTNSSPAVNVTGFSINFPVLISGPCVSNKVATGNPNSSLAWTKGVKYCSWSSKEPCEKLNLPTFIPANIISFKTSLSFVAGPIVHTIFVLFIFYSSNTILYVLF